jgi:hypothetical protein
VVREKQTLDDYGHTFEMIGRREVAPRRRFGSPTRQFAKENIRQNI